MTTIETTTPVWLVALVALATLTMGPGLAKTTADAGGTDELGVPRSAANATSHERPDESLGAYRNYTEMTERVHDLEADHPDLVTVEPIGTSVQGREIWMVTVTEPDDAGHKTEVLFDGATHGEEIIGGEVVLRALEEIVEGYGTNETLTSLVEGHELFFVPQVNPDGVAYIPDCDWYGNCRKNANGVDLNRNFDINWGGEGASSDPSSATYHGPEPFSEPESTAIANVLDTSNIAMHWSVHSGTDLILWPWAYTREAPPERGIYQEVGQTLEDLTGVRHGQASDVLYVASGTTKDYSYGASSGAHPLAFTPELYGGSGSATEWWSYFNPPEHRIDDVYETWRPAIFESIRMADRYTDIRIQAEDLETPPLDVELDATLLNGGERVFEDGTLTLDAPEGLSVNGNATRDVGTLAKGDTEQASWLLTPQAAGTFDVGLAASSPLMGTFDDTVSVEVPPIGVEVSSRTEHLTPRTSAEVDLGIGALPHEELDGAWSLTVTGDTAAGPHEETLAEGTIDADGERVQITDTESFDAGTKSDGTYTATLALDYEGVREGQAVSGTVQDTHTWTLERPEVHVHKELASPVPPGQPVDVEAAFPNAGSLPAEDVEIQETVPPGYVIVPTADDGYDVHDRLAEPRPDTVLVRLDGSTELIWEAGTLDPGEAFEVSYTLEPLLLGSHEHRSESWYEHGYPDRVEAFETRVLVDQQVGPG